MAASPVELPYLHAGFGMPERQNRWTVAFRLILAIPHFVVFVALGIASYVILVIGWFAALFMGRLPRWAADYLRGYIVYATRVYAYFWLMLDTYPPFGWDTGKEYPVNLDVPYGRVRRLAVLFRIILMVPAEIVLGLVLNGFQLILVFVWLIVLVAGKMPVALFSAVAAILRFEARCYAYFGMLTSKYPGELFGDSAVAPVPPGPMPAYPPGPAASFGVGTPGATLPAPVPPYPGEGTTPPPPPPAAVGTPAPPPMPAPVAPPGPPVGAPPAGPPRTARLVLGRSAKRLLVLFIVLGVLEYAAIVAVAATVNTGSLNAFNSVVEAHNTLSTSIGAAQAQLQSCGAGSLSCNETYQGQLATAFQQFAGQLSTISFPDSVQAQVRSLESDASQLVGLLQQMSTAPDAATYQSEFSQAQPLGSKFDSDYASLVSALV